MEKEANLDVKVDGVAYRFTVGKKMEDSCKRRCDLNNVCRSNIDSGYRLYCLCNAMENYVCRDCNCGYFKKVEENK